MSNTLKFSVHLTFNLYFKHYFTLDKREQSNKGLKGKMGELLNGRQQQTQRIDEDYNFLSSQLR